MTIMMPEMDVIIVAISDREMSHRSHAKKERPGERIETRSTGPP